MPRDGKDKDFRRVLYGIVEDVMESAFEGSCRAGDGVATEIFSIIVCCLGVRCLRQKS